MLLTYELENIKNELTTLLYNSKNKKEESLSKMLNFRAEIKEIDAVMAAREESYSSYGAQAQPLLNIVMPAPMLLSSKLAAFYINIRSHIQDLTQVAADETFRITHLRDAYQTQLAFIQRKSKEIYAALHEEKRVLTLMLLFYKLRFRN